MPISQERFTRGEETRLQPNRQKDSFRDLLEYERQLIELTDAYNKKVTPAINMDIRRRPETAIHYPHLVGDLRKIKQIQSKVDVQYQWYYIAYLPLNSLPEMVPPDDYVYRPPSLLENFISLLFHSRTSVNDGTIVQQIKQYESDLDEMLEKLDDHDRLAREIDSDMSKLPAKYHAWLRRRRTVVEIQEVQQTIARLECKLREISNQNLTEIVHQTTYSSNRILGDVATNSRRVFGADMD